jgi:hypothetical protein
LGLNEKELFIDTIYYGKKCGHNGIVVPNEQKVIDIWVNNVDTINLYKWLQSTNAEKQIYAVQRFKSLLIKGHSIDDKIKPFSFKMFSKCILLIFFSLKIK